MDNGQEQIVVENLYIATQIADACDPMFEDTAFGLDGDYAPAALLSQGFLEGDTYMMPHEKKSWEDRVSKTNQLYK